MWPINHHWSHKLWNSKTNFTEFQWTFSQKGKTCILFAAHAVVWAPGHQNDNSKVNWCMRNCRNGRDSALHPVLSCKLYELFWTANYVSPDLWKRCQGQLEKSFPNFRINCPLVLTKATKKECRAYCVFSFSLWDTVLMTELPLAQLVSHHQNARFWPTEKRNSDKILLSREFPVSSTQTRNSPCQSPWYSSWNAVMCTTARDTGELVRFLWLLANWISLHRNELLLIITKTIQIRQNLVQICPQKSFPAPKRPDGKSLSSGRRSTDEIACQRNKRDNEPPRVKKAGINDAQARTFVEPFWISTEKWRPKNWVLFRHFSFVSTT